MLRSWLILGVAFCSLASLADKPCENCDKPPYAVFAFTLEAAQSLYNESAVPTKEQLAGPWKRLGSISIPDMPVNDTKGYDAKGLFNSDGSLNTLHFGEGADVTGKFTQTATLANCGRKGLDQGPYAYELRGPGACFSQFVFAWNTVSTDAYGAYRCRLTKSNQLVCTITMYANGNAPEYLRKLNGRVTTYRLYAR